MKLTIETVLSQGGETMKQRMLADATRLRKDSGFVLSYVEDETNTRESRSRYNGEKCRM